MDPSSTPNPASTPAPEKKPFDRAALLWGASLFAVALALRLVWVLAFPHAVQFSDEKQYLNMSDSLLRNIEEDQLRNADFEITVDGATDQPLHIPLILHRAPGYPLMLAVVLKLGGEDRAIRVVQAALGALACILVYLLARELAGVWPGRIAGALFAIDPFSIYFTGLVLSETLFVLLLVTSWFLVVRMWRACSAGERATEWLASCIIAGLLAAGAVLTRPEGLAIFALVPVAWLVVGPRRIKGLGVSLLFLLVMLMGLSPWVARNYRRTWDQETKRGQLILTTCNVGESLFEAMGPKATGGPNKENTEWPPGIELLPADECARDRFLYEKARDAAMQDPSRALRLAGVKLARTWNLYPNYEGDRTARNKGLSAGFLFPVYLLAIVGLGAMARRRELAWTLVPILAITAVHVVFVGSIRYRVPMEPLLFALSGAGAAWAFAKVFVPPAEKGPA